MFCNIDFIIPGTLGQIIMSYNIRQYIVKFVDSLGAIAT